MSNLLSMPALTERLHITRRGYDPVVVGQGLGHTRESLTWLGNQIMHATRQRR